ncbi:MAG TPA: trypsin-like peptidase domain-containing protein [Geminicoccaceae bacterium]|nr:trypsin-like peptidase domain-containing protein [Geminicoccaceae bacterium]
MATRIYYGLVGPIAGWLCACAASPEPPAEPPAAPPPAVTAAAPPQAPPIDWGQARDCRDSLRLLEEAATAGRLNPDERPPIAVALPGGSGGLDWLAPPSVAISADLPLEVHERADAAALAVPCVLQIEPARDQRVGHRLVDRATVRSLYENGVRSERNPDYDLAQMRVRQAERELRDDGPDVLKVGDPTLDLVGLLIGGVFSGFSQGARARELDEAATELASIPRSRDRALYRAYEFERITMIAGKEATIPVALLDRANGRVWRAELRQRERREVVVLEGLDPRDRDYDKHSAATLSRQDFERWQRAPPQLQLSAIAAALREANPAPAPAPRAREPEAIAADPGPSDPVERDPWSTADARAHALGRDLAGVAPGAGPPPATPGDPRAAGVVQLTAGERSGSGVYVRSDLILTTAQLVDRTSVVDVVTSDGARVLGLVARTDPLRGLALVQVARAGPPVTFYDGPPLVPGRPLEAIALAAGGAATVMPGQWRGTDPAFAGRAYIDTSAAPAQAQATPWFLGDRVIALVAGDAPEQPEGSPAAVRASEILAFLYGNGGAQGAAR